LHGSFFDFAAERFSGTNRQEISSCKGGWGGRAAIDWVRRLSDRPGYDAQAERFIEVAKVLDAIYGRRSAAFSHGS
jgi:hypothetical protein